MKEIKENKNGSNGKHSMENGVKTYDDTSWGYRHQQSLVLFIFLTIAYSIRTCMGVALVAMITRDPIPKDSLPNNTTNLTSTNPNADFKINGFFSAMFLTPPYPTVDWSKQKQDFVLAAFFWGYFLMQLPGGHFAHRFGTRRVLTTSMIVNSIMFLIAPWMVYYGGWIAMTACRAVQGLAQGVVFPAMHAFFGKWARLEERARLTSYAYAGISLGPVVGLLLAGLTAGSPLGWPGALRLFSLLAAIAAAAVWFWLADTPESHPRISHAERRFIHDGLGAPDGKKRRPIPWIAILCHPGQIAIIIAHIASTWIMNTMYVEMPIYMDKVLKVNVKANGLLMALPFLVMFLSNFAFGWIGDVLIMRRWLSVMATRKLLNGFGFVMAALGLIAMEFAPNDVLIIESLLIFINATKVASHCGFFVNHIDISPNYAGVLLSISNFVANLVGAQAPLVTGLIVKNASNQDQWKVVFRISAAQLLIAAALYQWLGTGERAPWDQPSLPHSNKNTDEEEKPMINVKMELLKQ